MFYFVRTTIGGILLWAGFKIIPRTNTMKQAILRAFNDHVNGVRQ